ncbi:MAG: class I SAM-dependent methyltransferase [Actinomycetota bacterium]|nr:class I SAM-dependent methyltransferase [Actinomycetota bacterium]
MHSPEEAALLRRLAADARRVVEIGVYEGGSAALLAQAMPADGDLHLIDPFGEQPDALRAGCAAFPSATRRVVHRAARRGGPRVRWHIDYSYHVARRWGAVIDLLFVDGNHSREGCRRDWDLFHRHVAPGGRVAFHDARLNRPGGRGLPGPTEVVDELFRHGTPPAGWAVETEIDRTVVVRQESVRSSLGPEDS